MRVLIVNTSEKTGGAAVAASRLKDALNHNGIKAKMLVRDKLTDDITVVSLRKGLGTKWHFLWERFCVFFKLRFSRKKKEKLYNASNISFVACSRWLANEAKASGLLKNQVVTAIPNPINTQMFNPNDKRLARQLCGFPEGKRLILFVAQRATNVNKGMSYLIEACNQLTHTYPEMCDNTALVILGGQSDDFEGQFRMQMFPLGYVSDEAQIVNIYNAVDTFVLPSLSENLPNTIMEAMACGVPCVGFRVGGIPEMIDHHTNGYVATARSSDDLARGIRWVLDEADYEAISVAAVRKVQRSYSRHNVAMRYIEIYNQALAMNNYQI